MGPLGPGDPQGRWDLQDLLVLASQGLQEVKATWETMESEDNLDKKVNLPRNSLNLRGGGSDAKLTVCFLFQVKKVHKEI